MKEKIGVKNRFTEEAVDQAHSRYIEQLLKSNLLGHSQHDIA